MEKRFREYLKHFEKLDYDVLSDEEILDEKSNLQLKTTVLHQEMVRLLIIMMGLIMCISIFLGTYFLSKNIITLIIAAVLALVVIYNFMQYRGVGTIIKKLDSYVDKLTML